MTKEEFKYIWKTKVAANGPWYPAASDKYTAKRYRNLLLRYDKAVLNKAVDRLSVDEAGNKDQAKGLPWVGKFIEYCRWVLGEIDNPQPPKLCPCCQQSGWIYLKEKNAVTPCDCNYHHPQSLRITIPKKCETGECSPGGMVLINEKPFKLPECPKGKDHYEKYLKKSREKFKELREEEVVL